jgi:site-specific DNA recombinase
MKNGLKKKLRFAILIRVSSERQAKKGESLRTQKAQIESAVESLDGRIVKRYGGQEHATAGWEHAQVDQLVADAQKKPRPFDAIMVTHPDRWSRDNVKSETGLALLQECGVRFFELLREYDLFDPGARMYLSLSTTIGAYQAATQKKKSIENRIARAKRGFPTCGRQPYGRIFDKETGKWGLDKEKVNIIKDAAERYLQGESLKKLAEEYGMNTGGLHKTLTKRCGTTWSQRFQVKDFGIDETVEIKIPPLLPPKTIAALRKRSAGNKTWSHGRIKHQYLLSRMTFCQNCGHSLSGQTTSTGKRYYRHFYKRQNNSCTKPISHIPADELEEAVMLQLFLDFGNPKAVERAIERAVPNLEKINTIRERIGRIDDEVANIAKGRDRLIARVVKGTVDEEEADRQLDKSKERRDRLQEERNRLAGGVEGIPEPGEIKRKSKQVSDSINALIGKHAHTVNRDFLGMSYEDKRALVEMVFSGNTPDGKRFGVYVEAMKKADGGYSKLHRYTIHGHFVNYEGFFPMPTYSNEVFINDIKEFGAGAKQKRLTKSTSRSQRIVLRG